MLSQIKRSKVNKMKKLSKLQESGLKKIINYIKEVKSYQYRDDGEHAGFSTRETRYAMIQHRDDAERFLKSKKRFPTPKDFQAMYNRKKNNKNSITKYHDISDVDFQELSDRFEYEMVMTSRQLGIPNKYD